jgi:hypothetical protein
VSERIVSQNEETGNGRRRARRNIQNKCRFALNKCNRPDEAISRCPNKKSGDLCVRWYFEGSDEAGKGIKLGINEEGVRGVGLLL